MKLISEDILKEFGFTEKNEKADTNIIKIMSKEGFNIVIRNDGIYYVNMGLSYPLRDTAALKKLFKEVNRKELAQG